MNEKELLIYLQTHTAQESEKYLKQKINLIYEKLISCKLARNKTNHKYRN